jgi:hypothetical protein
MACYSDIFTFVFNTLLLKFQQVLY